MEVKRFLNIMILILHIIIYYYYVHVLILLYNFYDVLIAKYVHLSVNFPDNSAIIGAAVGGVVGAMVTVVAVTAMVVLTVYCFICARRKGSIDL